MVSRDKQEPEALHTQKVMYKQHMNGVSNAFWPSNVRRGVHTNKVAQQRRIIIMLAIECMNSLKLWHIYWQYLVSAYMFLQRLVQLLCIIVILGIAVLLAVFYDWGYNAKTLVCIFIVYCALWFCNTDYSLCLDWE